ncbi:Dynactin subunit 6 [Clydaea vesicula]|uniref:Dynactin subunit 6 n=1 Tax=Clydaea vesicula TaxID=447962 RepID=A0AAD5U7C2_9FUNG|nr:Dynactin subunit 6 [Clydaea vesicula]KAJ3396018.1 Dynactin subunit 6 [Lobulomyces angularis]
MSLICSNAIIEAPVTFGENTTVHPKAHIKATGGGAIIFGSNNIINERAVINNLTAAPLIIGDNNVFNVGCLFEGKRMGSNNTLESKSFAMKNSVFGDNIILGSKCSVNEQIDDFMVIYGKDNVWRKVQEGNSMKKFNDNQVLHSKHLDYLKEVLPKYHTIKKHD